RCAGREVDARVGAAEVTYLSAGIVLREEDMVRAKRLGATKLSFAGVDGDHLHSRHLRQLNSVLAQAATADDHACLAGLQFRLSKTAVGGDACAEQRRGVGGVER